MRCTHLLRPLNEVKSIGAFPLELAYPSLNGGIIPLEQFICLPLTVCHRHPWGTKGDPLNCGQSPKQRHWKQGGAVDTSGNNYNPGQNCPNPNPNPNQHWTGGRGARKKLFWDRLEVIRCVWLMIFRKMDKIKVCVNTFCPGLYYTVTERERGSVTIALLACPSCCVAKIYGCKCVTKCGRTANGRSQL